MLTPKKIVQSPWFFVPILFIAVGSGGGGIVGSLTAVMFKDLGYSNVLVGAVAILSLPSSLRFLWSPWIDGLGSKRDLCWRFISGMSFMIAFLALIVYTGIVTPLFAFLIIFAFTIIFSSFEVAADGYYIRVFDRKRQAEFVGIKAAAIRGGILISVVFFVTWAGELQETYFWSINHAWGMAVFGAALLLAFIALYAKFFLPIVDSDYPVKDPEPFPLLTILKEYITQERAWAIIGMLLIFRFGQGILIYMAPAFYMDPFSLGGYAMNAKDIGLLKALTDMPWMTAGGIFGGFVIMKFGLKRTIIPFTLLMCLPNFAFVFLAFERPMATFELFGRTYYQAVFIVSCIESLGYGIGFSGFFYYIHAVASGKHKTSMLAVSSGVMGLGFYLPGAVSGVLQQLTNYVTVFAISSIVGLFTLVIVPFLPMPKFDADEVEETT